MHLANFIIYLREKLLDGLSGSDHSHALNVFTAQEPDSLNGNPADELHQLLMEMLSTELATHEGGVDYSALRASPLYAVFRACTQKLRSFDPTTLPNRNARLAFWINLYNTLVLDAVIALNVKRSVTEQRAGISFFRRAAYVVGGQRLSCDDIEHGILRANRGHPLFPGRQFATYDARLKWVVEPFEVRIHFALNCASRSCPPIRAYAPEKLDSQLNLATQSFLSSDVEITPAQNTLQISSIFKWFAADFGGRNEVIEFVLSHLSNEEEFPWSAKRPSKISLRHKPYNWGLNDKAQPRPLIEGRL